MFYFLLGQFPTLKRFLKETRNRFFPNRSVSSHYKMLKRDEAIVEGQRLRNSWQDDNLPIRQRELVEQQLNLFRSGSQIDVFDVFVQALRGLPKPKDKLSLLEVGCSSGYYSEVLKIAGLPITYSGCDYSEAFIKMAKELYPSLNFSIEDATDLQHTDRSFDIVVSGCCLLHIPEYAKAVQETARVTRSYAIFHRTPVVWGKPEQWYRKQAYGIDSVDIHFNEPDFLALLDKNGLDLIGTYTLNEESVDSSQKEGHANRTYVCRKKEDD